MRKQYHRFLQKNRNKGIPNLMLYLCLANAALYLYILFTNDVRPVEFMSFHAASIMRGEVWRLFTWVFTRGADYVGRPLGIVYIFFYVTFNRWIGSVLEHVWGTLRANIFFFTGFLLSTLAGMIVWWTAYTPVFLNCYYIELSMILAVATIIPDERILLFGVFPIQLRWFAYLDIGIYLLEIFRNVALVGGPFIGTFLLIATTQPIVSLLNYALHMGREMANLLPNRGNFKSYKRKKEFKKAAEQPNPDWAKNYRNSTGERPYRHKCTVCGRTDTDTPGLEFRYCSRCKGYFCYCIDHINNHSHVE